MPRVQFGARALEDLERLSEFLAGSDVTAATRAIDTILDAVDVLGRHPLIGRPVQGPVRELVISLGATGYVALYRWTPRRDTVEVLAVRHQRKAGYS